MNEVWNPVPGFPLYEVSSLGRIRSWAVSGFTGRKSEFPKFLKPVRNKVNGYFCVAVRNSSLKKISTVHVLVAIAFHGDRRSEGLQVAHLDGNKLNNAAANLAWVTHRENQSHKEIHGTVTRGVRNGCAKFDERIVRAVLWLYGNKKANQYELADAFGVTQSAISDLVSGKTYQESVETLRRGTRNEVEQ